MLSTAASAEAIAKLTSQVEQLLSILKNGQLHDGGPKSRVFASATSSSSSSTIQDEKELSLDEQKKRLCKFLRDSQKTIISRFCEVTLVEAEGFPATITYLEESIKQPIPNGLNLLQQTAITTTFAEIDDGLNDFRRTHPNHYQAIKFVEKECANIDLTTDVESDSDSDYGDENEDYDSDSDDDEESSQNIEKLTRGLLKSWSGANKKHVQSLREMMATYGARDLRVRPRHFRR